MSILTLQKIEKRRKLARIYDECFKNNKEIIIPRENKNAQHSYHLYVIRVNKNKRDGLIQKLKEEGIFLGIHYPVPVHKQPIN